MLSPQRLGYATKPNSHELLNEHNLIRFVVVLDASFKCSDEKWSSGTVLVQSFGLNAQLSSSSCPPSCVSCRSKRFRREENVSPRGRRPDSPPIGKRFTAQNVSKWRPLPFATSSSAPPILLTIQCHHQPSLN